MEHKKMGPDQKSTYSKEEKIDFANKKIIEKNGGSNAISKTVIGVYNDNGHELNFFEGSFEATVLQDVDEYEQTEKGFDFDHILVPKNNNPQSKTVGKLLTDNEEVQKPRKIALNKFKEFLSDLNICKLNNFPSKKLSIN